jgi:PKD repeat protein
MKRHIRWILVLAMLWASTGVRAGRAATPAPAPSATTDAITLTYTFEAPTVTRAGAYDRVTLPGLENRADPGAPNLPVRVVRVLLPFGTTAGRVEVQPGKLVDLDGRYTVEPAQELRPRTDPDPAVPTPPDPDIYRQDTAYPAALSTRVGEQTLAGHRILLMELSPVRYTPASGALAYYEQLTVRVTPAADAEVAAAQRSRLSEAEADRARLRALVDNPQELAAYAGVQRTAGVPQSSLVSAGDPYDYVLITSSSMSSVFQPLVNHKISKGLNATLFTTEDIYANYSGVDDPDRLRNFIIDAYTTWSGTAHPLKYVVLGGDDEIVPVRYLYAPGSGLSSDGGWMPSDMYYAGLDGTWDADGDGLYGEAASSSIEEECDFFTEVAIGRLSVDTTTQATHLVNKIINYEQTPTASHLKEATFIGQQLDSITWGGNGKDTVAELVPQYDITTFYSRDGTYDTDDIVDDMNVGTHLVNFNGHGNWSSSPLYNSLVDTLTNTQHFLVYSLGCYTGAFDQDVSGDSEALAEHYIFGEHGAFAYIGNTRYGWYSPGSTNGPGEVLDRNFFEAVANDGPHSLGDALQAAKEQYYPGSRWSLLTLTLFGDPEMSLVRTFSSPSADITAPQGSSLLRGDVNLWGTARAGEAAGASFDHYTLAYGQGLAPTSWTQIGSAQTTPVTDGLLLEAWDTTVIPDGVYTLKLTVDDGSGQTGEDRVVVEIDNVYITAPATERAIKGGGVLDIYGTAQGTDFSYYQLHYGRGKSPSSWTYLGTYYSPVENGWLGSWNTSGLVTDYYVLRLTLVGTQHTTVEASLVYLDPDLQAGWAQPIVYRVTGEGIAAGDLAGDGLQDVVVTESDYKTSYVRVWQHDGVYQSGWPRSFYDDWMTAPALADLDRDGDQEIIAGSDANRMHVWHAGGMEVPGWPQSADAVIWESPAIGDLDRDGFPEIVAVDGDGKVYVWHGDGSAATGWPLATGLDAEAPPALADLDGDDDLEILVAVSGYIHAWHHTGAAVSGWPINTGETAYGGPVVGDLDNDGDQEVVLATADSVHAWHHTGTPMTGWPQTINFTYGAPGLGDLDGDNDLEIVVGDNGYARAWHHTGSVVAGWPIAQSYLYRGQPLLVNLDGDALPEVLIAASYHNDTIYAWHGDGSAVSGWPRVLPDFDGDDEKLATPHLTDLDGDGDVEMLSVVESQVMIWDLSAADSPLPWPTYRGNVHRTGAYGEAPNLPPAIDNARADPGYVAPGGSVTVTARVYDEDGVQSVSAQIESPDETVWATLTLYDDGAHGDGAAGDGVFGNTWTTSSTQREYVVDIAASDGSAAVTRDNITGFTTQDAAYVQYESASLSSESLTPDGAINPGEYVRICVTLENIGVLSAPGVTATLSTADPQVWYYDNQAAAFGEITAGSTASCCTFGDNYYLRMQESAPHNHVIPFTLNVYDANGNHWTDTFTLTVVDSVGPGLDWPYGIDPTGQLQPGQVVKVYADLIDASGIAWAEAEFESPDDGTTFTLPLYDDGLHDDGGADDGSYANTWTLDATPRNYHVNIRAADDLGNTRDHTHITRFTSHPFTPTGEILLVADNGSGTTDGWRHYYTETLEATGYTYDVWDVYWRDFDDTVPMDQYVDGAVVMAIPSYGAMYGETSSLKAYLDSGGRLFISGQNVGYYLSYAGYDLDLFNNYLHATLVQDDCDLYALDGVAGDVIGDGLSLSISGSGGANNQYSPEVIAPRSPATTTLTYAPDGLDGGLRVDTGTYRVVYLPFGFEAITDAGTRQTLMGRALAWLQGISAPVAAFTVSSPNWAGVPTVFTNTTTVDGPVSYLWDFGDGVTSTLEHPTHTYTSAADYYVTLTASNALGNSSTGQWVTVNSAATVYIDPAAGQAGQQATGTFNVAVQDVVDLGSFEFDLAFDPALMRVDDVALGDLLGSTGRSVGELGPSIDNAAGTLTYGGFSFGTPAGPTGDGTLAVITYTTLITPGVSPLDLSNVQLSDTDATPLPVASVDGSLEITGLHIGAPAYPASVASDAVVTVTVDIQNSQDGGQVAQATLDYGYAAPYDQASVGGVGPGGDGNGTWTFAVPAQGDAYEGSTLRFSITAEDAGVPPAQSQNTNGGSYFPVAITDDDTLPPTFANPAPTVATTVLPVTLRVDIGDAESGIADDDGTASSVYALWDTDGELSIDAQQVDMDLEAGDTYAIDTPIGPLSSGLTVTWQVYAQDDDNSPAGCWSPAYTTAIVDTIFGDLDYDCDVDIDDIMIVVNHWNTEAGSPGYVADYDFDGDGDIDVLDVMRVAAVWGDVCPGTLAAHSASFIPVAGGAVVGFDPAETQAAPGDAFTLQVTVAEVENLSGFEFDLRFDPEVITVTQVRLADFLGTSGNNVVHLGPQPREAGRLVFGGFGYGAADGADGGGAIAELDVTLRQPQDTVLWLEDVQLVDGEAETIAVERVNDGRIDVVNAAQLLYLPLLTRDR